MNGWTQLSVINQRPEASKRSEGCASLISNGLVSRLWLHEFFLHLVSRQKLHADLIAVDAHQFAAAKRQTRRRQKQEELPEIQSFERSFEAQTCSRFHPIHHHSLPPPTSLT